MPAERRGQRGEDYAAHTLERLGYQILARNAHSRYGEVDIVAGDGQSLCFVEVKTRRQDALVTGAEAVGVFKQRRIIKTALSLLQRYPQWEGQPRFDVFVVITDTRGNILEHDFIEGAFDGAAYEHSTGH